MEIMIPPQRDKRHRRQTTRRLQERRVKGMQSVSFLLHSAASASTVCSSTYNSSTVNCAPPLADTVSDSCPGNSNYGNVGK